MTPCQVAITFTPAQRALIRQASGKDIAELGIEPLDTGSGWLYTPREGTKSWLLKQPYPEAYRAIRKKQQPRIDSKRTSFRLRISPSGIHRWGVFAAERIPARRNVIEYTGELVNPVECYRRVKNAGEIYALRFDDFWRIDGSVGGSGAEFINHSCDPNLRWRYFPDRVFCQSLRRIEAGEELTLDYRFSSKTPKVRCRCGSAQCRGTINVTRSMEKSRVGKTTARKE